MILHYELHVASAVTKQSVPKLRCKTKVFDPILFLPEHTKIYKSFTKRGLYKWIILCAKVILNHSGVKQYVMENMTVRLDMRCFWL